MIRAKNAIAGGASTGSGCGRPTGWTSFPGADQITSTSVIALYYRPPLKPPSADPDFAVRDETVGWQIEIRRSRTATDAAGAVVLRAVAGAEPAIIITLMRKRNAAKMSADADHHEPLVVAVLDARAVRRRVWEVVPVHVARQIDVLLCAVADEDRLAAPEYCDYLTFSDRGEIDLDRSCSRDG